MKVRATPRYLVVVLAVLPLGCGDGQESQRGYGPKFAGASAVVDPGVLLDLTTYQPQKPPQATVPGAAARDTEAGADRAVRDLAEFLVGAIRDGDVTYALRAFEPTHVAALAPEQLDLVFANLESIAKIAARLGTTEATNLLGGLYGPGDEPLKVDVVDAKNAGVSPNVARVLFGPALAGPALKAKLGDDGWKLQLERPLVEADITEILAFHEKLRDALLKIAGYVRATDSPDPALLKAAAAAALAGQAVDLPVTEEGGSEQPAAEKAAEAGESPGEKPEDREP